MSQWVYAAEKLAEVMFAAPDGPADPARLAWLSHELDDFVDRIGFRSKVLIRSCIIAVDKGAPVLIGRFGRSAHELSFQDRERALHVYEKSPLSLSLFALKAILCILWFEHPDSEAEAGYDGACLTGGGEQ